MMKGVSVKDWLASIDLNDDHFHVLICQEHRMYLKFCIKNKCYKYKPLPFGLATYILSLVMGYLRLQSIKFFP